LPSSTFLLTIVFAVFAFAIFTSSGVASAEPGNLLFKIENPGLKQDLFGSSVRSLDGNIVVGASEKEVDEIPGAGAVYVFDGKTGSLLYTINNPEPSRGDAFGRYIATTDHNILVGLKIDTVADVGDKGIIYVFDGKTGSLLYTIKNPRENEFDEWFGYHMSSVGDNIVAGSIFKDPTNGKWTGVVYVFDGKDGSLLYTITNPNKDNIDRLFSGNIASVGDNIVISAFDEDPNDAKYTNVMYVFDGATGSLLYTVENPDQSMGPTFGRAIATTDDKIIAGVPNWEADDTNAGLIYVFDSKTGSLLHTITNPSENQEDRLFGMSIGVVGDNIVTASKTAYPNNDNLSDIIYVFDIKTGSLIYTIDDPEPDIYGASNPVITIVGDNIIISHANTNSFDPVENTIYVFEGFSSTISSISYIMIAIAAVVAAISVVVIRSRLSKKHNPELIH
jgi:hypothetical protein